MELPLAQAEEFVRLLLAALDIVSSSEGRPGAYA